MATSQVGDLIETQRQVDDLPVGSRIEVVEDPSEWYERVDEGWRDAGGSAYGGHFAMGGHNQVARVGSNEERPQETALQYMWRYRDIALRGVAIHGVSYSESIETIENLGCGGRDPSTVFPFGQGMPIRNRYDRENLPDNTVLLQGDPDGDRFGVWVKQGGSWIHLLGNLNSFNGDRETLRIELVGGQLIEREWLTATGTDEDVRSIVAFKKAAYRAGEELKSDQSWCSTYDSVVAAIGIDKSVLKVTEAAGVTIGTWIDAVQTSELPVGTVLKWEHSDSPSDDYAYFVRVDWSLNRAKTAKLFGRRASGENDTDGYKRRLQVVGFPDDSGEVGMGIEFPTIERDWNLLPAGTGLLVNGEHYTMCENHRTREGRPNNGTAISEAYGRWVFDNYRTGAANFRIEHLPMPTQPTAASTVGVLAT